MSLRRALFLSLLALAVLRVPPVRADKLDRDAKRWLDEVAPLILADEEKTFRSLKEKEDREEFQKIFWARRNPQGPAATENPFRAEYEKLRAEADRRFKVAGRPGSATDCARVLVLLGEPNETKKDTSGESIGPRTPEVWTFKDRPGYTFTGGQIQVPFDAQCQLPQGANFREQLDRPAEARVVNPNIGYTAKDGRLARKLIDMLPKPTPVQALLKEPQQDFTLEAQPKLVMRGKDGTYLGGLVRADANGLTPAEEGGKKRVAVVVAAQALDDAGRVVASSPDLETSPDVAADGSFLASYGLTLKPGKYTVRVAAFEPKSKKGSVAQVPFEAPDFAAPELTLSDIVILTDIQERAAQDPKDPLAAFFMGTAQLVPRFGNVFTKAEAIQVLAFIYSPVADPATGKSSCAASFVITKDGKPVTAKSEDQVFDGPAATPGIGPVPLAKFEPGKYSAQIKVTDRVAKKDYSKEATFEVKP